MAKPRKPNLGQTTRLTPEEQKFEARVEEEVRRRISAILGSAGLPETAVAKEVLYWLPEEFIEYYRDLFLRSVKLEGRGHEGNTRINSRGDRVSVEDNRRVGVGTVRQRRRESDEAYAERTRGLMGHTSGGGKRYKESYTIRDEGAFRERQLVDRRLIELAHGVGLKARDRRKGNGQRNT